MVIHYYDRAGQLSRTHSPDQPDKDVRYHYDQLGRLTRIQYSDPEEDVTYQYDQSDKEHGAGIGRLTRITSRHSQIDYRYDPHGNLLTDSRKTIIDGNTYEHQISYSYTTGNQLASITYPNGQTVHYHYQNGRHSQVVLQEENNKKDTPLITHITHRPFGGMDSWTYGNGLTQRLEHDLDGRITAVRVQDEQQDPIWQQAYQYDRLDNITGIERSEGQETYQQQFGYDMLQRLIQDQGPYGQQRFEYDAVGNRLSQHYAKGDTTEIKDGSDDNLTRYHYAPASNRLLGTTEKDIVLDPAGNTLQESNALQHSYAYNAQNRISEYTRDGQLKARYHYNALGQRIHKAIVQTDGSEQHTLFHYDQQGQLLGETQLNGIKTNEEQKYQHTQNIVWLQMRPIVAIDTTENQAAHIAWLHSDHLLTARAATDANQNIIWRWESDAFGLGEAESLAQAGQPELILNLRFPGQYHDEESGLYYNYFRTYDPSKGRYTQSDPIGLAGGINTYSYVKSRPMEQFDRLGLLSDCDELLLPDKYRELVERAGISLADNANEARGMSVFEWIESVETGGVWDYKDSLSGQGIDPTLLDDFGNFHFGMVAAAHGFSLEISMAGAGAYQVIFQGKGSALDLYAATGLLQWTALGYVLPNSASRHLTNSGFTWGDNPGDAKNIMEGWNYYHGN